MSLHTIFESQDLTIISLHDENFHSSHNFFGLSELIDWRVTKGQADPGEKSKPITGHLETFQLVIHL
ncbi:hypothetical protein E4T56_gene762 [Termitomyces sp. T112]|nr:hypothetical protein E4T56_gene762 [Termitomyces sp. T112]